jgi:hypothetical protein
MHASLILTPIGIHLIVQAQRLLQSFGDEIFAEDEMYLDMATAISGTGAWMDRAALRGLGLDGHMVNGHVLLLMHGFTQPNPTQPRPGICVHDARGAD